VPVRVWGLTIIFEEPLSIGQIEFFKIRIAAGLTMFVGKHIIAQSYGISGDKISDESRDGESLAPLF